MNQTAQPLCPCPVHPAWEGGAVLRQRLPCRGGEVLLTRYLLFPGMALTYRDVHAAAWEAAGEAGTDAGSTAGRSRSCCRNYPDND